MSEAIERLRAATVDDYGPMPGIAEVVVTVDDLNAALDLIAVLDAGPQIKPLVWRDWIYGDGQAKTVFGTYHVWDGYWRAPGEQGGTLSTDPKAAAQHDYETRIRATLEVSQ